MTQSDFDQMVEAYQRTVDAFVMGDPEPQKEMWSHQDDVCLANPLGPAVRGWHQVNEALDDAATLFDGGERIGIEQVTACVTPELAFRVEVERYSIRLHGREGSVPSTFRVTTIFRHENGDWKIVHRHADPISAPRSLETILQQ